MKKLKIKTEMLRRNGTSHKAVESVLRPELRESMVVKICEKGRS